MKALLIGGSADGMVYDVQYPTNVVRGAVAPKIDWRADLDEEVVTHPVSVDYRRTLISVLGMTIPVFVLAGWPMERTEATLSRLLLTDLAHTLAEEAT